MKIALILPGPSFSGRFLTCFLDLIVFFYEKKIECCLYQSASSNIYSLREILADQVIKNKLFDYDYMLWIDSDQLFNRGHVEKLLDANKDIIAGYTKTIQGNWTFGFNNGKCESEMNEKDIFQATFVGFGMVLIKKGVFEKLQKPFFGLHYSDNGDFWGEDIGFCIKAKESGFPIHIHPEVRLGHEKKMII